MSGASSSTLHVTIKGEGLNIAMDVSLATANAMISLAMGGTVAASDTASRSSAKPRRRAAAKPTVARTGKAKPKSRRPGMVNDLQLRPKGKPSFVDFATEKQPDGHFEKQAVILYWLRHVAGVAAGISLDHVNTCYVAAEWPRPAALASNMRLGATRTKWLDTSDRSNLTLTTVGEDMVKHKLPRAPKSGSK